MRRKNLSKLSAADQAAIATIEYNPAQMSIWREIFEALPEAVLVLSREGEPLAINAAAENLLEASITGQLIDYLRGQNRWLHEMIDSCFKTGQSLDNPDGELYTSRRRFSVHAQVSPVIERRGPVNKVILQLQDLTGQHGMHRATDPERRVLRLSPAGFAHELKNPLTGIKGAAELLSGLFQADPQARQYCEIILHGVDRIAGLVEQALAATAPGRLKRAPLNIHQVLHQALRSAGLFESRHDLKIEQLFDPSLPELIGDPEALERVFVNLLRNAVEAVQASEASQGAILLQTSLEPQFKLSANGQRRQFMRIEISDSGKGMSQDEMEQLFAPFFTTKAHGTGLGLVLSQRIVALHGGKLWAERRASETRRSTSENTMKLSGMTFCTILPFGGDAEAERNQG